MDSREDMPGKRSERLRYWQSVVKQDENAWQSVRDNLDMCPPLSSAAARTAAAPPTRR